MLAALYHRSDFSPDRALPTYRGVGPYRLASIQLQFVRYGTWPGPRRDQGSVCLLLLLSYPSLLRIPRDLLDANLALGFDGSGWCFRRGDSEGAALKFSSPDIRGQRSKYGLHFEKGQPWMLAQDTRNQAGYVGRGEAVAGCN